MTEKAGKLVNDLTAAVHIAESILMNTPKLTEYDKKTTNDFHNEILDILKINNLTVASVISLINTFLVSWNEGISVEVEKFWKEINAKKINFKRKEPLRKLLEKGRFRNVHEAMEALENFNAIVSSGIIKDTYTEKEIEDIFKLIDQTSEARMSFLRQCLTSKRIVKSKWSYFGDCWAYAHTINLISKYFTEDEIDELSMIWDNVCKA